ncbi:AtpZ/AtpI family protein [Paeniglutamicibacter antarcticus]|uniref:AtpZ/AtpI family protein n=1 Tax=Arthrobacter terrae TaxID=2935737 RepID=A0A931CMF2_9MICC|nr:AtpZ/AtpI family protein [Arthrobacter terrae]MBG0741277.1 AtpZ/AtpI family protein [Arthrobacter terrae]
MLKGRRRKGARGERTGERVSVASSGSTDANGNGGYNAGLSVFSYVLGGTLVWSLIGWGLDNVLGTHWFVLAGAFIGLAGGFYLSFARRLVRNRTKDAAGTQPVEGPKRFEQP